MSLTEEAGSLAHRDELANGISQCLAHTLEYGMKRACESRPFLHILFYFIIVSYLTAFV